MRTSLDTAYCAIPGRTQNISPSVALARPPQRRLLLLGHSAQRQASITTRAADVHGLLGDGMAISTLDEYLRDHPE